jgi:hypothetical protein
LEDGVNSPAAQEENLAARKRQYEEAISLTKDARLAQQKDGDYYDGYQLTREEKRVLKRRKQPDNVWNFTRLWVNGTLGVIKQGATDPRAYPRNPQDEDSADVASKTLRFIADKANFDSVKVDVAKDYLVPGTGAVIIEADGDLNITVTQIRWEEFFYDPRSRLQDFSDARYMGVAKWVWADDLREEYPDKAAEIDGAFASSGLSFDETMDDRPLDAGTVGWVDKRQKRLMKVEVYYRKGGAWMRCVFHAGGVLESGPSPYLDDKKQPCNPIEAQSCYVDRENNRMGIVRDMRGPQDEINKRSAKLLHELNTRQIQEISPGSGQGDIDVARSEAAKPDGVIPSGWQIVPRQDIVSGQERLLQGAISVGERFAPNPAVVGRSNNTSGRQDLIRQQAGMTEQAIVFGGIEEWEHRCYRQMWNRARQYWTAPMWVRVTDDEGSPEFIGINQPPKMPGPPVMGPGGQPMPGEPQPLPPMPDMTAQPDAQGRVPQAMQNGKPVFQGPNGQPVLGYENALAELDVDIIVDSVPDTANVQQEQFALLIELAKMYGPQEVPFDDLLESSSMPNKRKVMDKRKARQEQAAQQQNNPQAQLALRGATAKVAQEEAKVGETQANTALTEAKARNEFLKPQVEAFQAAAMAFQNPPPGLTGAPPMAGA